jgi:hypothetical protein
MARRVVEQKPRSGLLTFSWASLVTDLEKLLSQAVAVAVAMAVEVREGGDDECMSAEV